MNLYVTSTVSRAQLDATLTVLPAYMRAILLAVRDHGCAWLAVPQRSGPFGAPEGKPTIAIIGDDTDRSVGPTRFHRKSLRRLLRSCRLISVVACEPLPIAYVTPAALAVGARFNAVIIETRPEHELEWIRLVKAENPDAQLIICTTQGRAQ